MSRTMKQIHDAKKKFLSSAQQVKFILILLLQLLWIFSHLLFIYIPIEHKTRRKEAIHQVCRYAGKGRGEAE